MDIRTPAYIPQSVVTRIIGRNIWECPWREMLSARQIQSIVLTLLWISGCLLKSWTLVKQSINIDGHRCHLSFHLDVCHEPALVPGGNRIRAMSSQHAGILASFQCIGSWFLFQTSCFLFVCIWVPNLLPESKWEVLLRGKIKMVLSKPVYHGV